MRRTGGRPLGFGDAPRKKEVSLTRSIPGATPGNLLLPVLPLREVCLFPESSLGLVVSRPGAVAAIEMAVRGGKCLLAVAQRDAAATSPNPRDLQSVGTVAFLMEDLPLTDGGRRVELDGLRRGRVVSLIGVDVLIAEVQPLDEDDPGDEWGPAVEALARYLHTHADLRSFLDQQRRSKEPMSWVNLACQHLPITASARQKLLESEPLERCLKISRGLDALLRKEKGE
ncbi:MAG TPA: LON peptidase substrate-binding domain-containing protein [Vicinamibacteria bacterium]|nr:LON peptidase substrate-binding domain-containing protein [Vicinamibacteria bacterium]